MFTGDLPSEHGNFSRSIRFDELLDYGTFLDRMEMESTWGVSANGYANSSFGFDDLFDEFVDVYDGVRYPSAIDLRKFVRQSDREGMSLYLSFLRAAVTSSSPVGSLTNGVGALTSQILENSRLPVPTPFDGGAKAVLSSVEELEFREPFFGFVNVMDAHSPLADALHFDSELYSVPSGWTSANIDFVDEGPESVPTAVDNYRSLYRAAVDYVDRIVDRVIDVLDEQTDRETTVVLTADHGDNLGYASEWHQWGHVYCNRFTDSLLNVPMAIVNAPEGYDDIEQGLFSHLDLGRLLVALSRGETPHLWRELSPFETMGVGTIQSSDLNESDIESKLAEWDVQMRGVATEEGELIQWQQGGEAITGDGSDYRTGAPESHDQSTLESVFGDDFPSVSGDGRDDIDQATQERLERLGYRE
jgi:hypothetical protein